MTSIDRLPLTTAPDLDPSTFNTMDTPSGNKVSAYYSPLNRGWVVYGYQADMFYQLPGINATDWPEVWAEIISKEQAG